MPLILLAASEAQPARLENMLGNDVYGDPQFSGTIYELRIWDGAVSPLYLAVSAAAGPSVVVTNLTPTSVSVTVTTSMIQGQTQQAAVVGNFVQTHPVLRSPVQPPTGPAATQAFSR